MAWWLAVLSVILVLLLLVFWRERVAVYYWLSLYAALLFQKEEASANTSGLSTPAGVRDTVLEWVRGKQQEWSNLHVIDLCCGEGDFLALLAHKVPTLKLTGVELDPAQCKIAQKRIRQARIWCQDMQEYQFPRTGALLLYMYEPLWEVEDASIFLPVYERVLSNVSRVSSKQHVAVLYVTGIRRFAQIPESLFQKYGFHLEKETAAARLLWHSNRMSLWVR